jgi:hypothetical protein
MSLTRRGLVSGLTIGVVGATAFAVTAAPSIDTEADQAALAASGKIIAENRQQTS